MSDQNSSLTIRIGVAGGAAAIADIKKVAGSIAGAFGFITAEFDPSKAFDGIKDALQFGDALQKLHNRTGASVAALTAIDEALGHVGSSAENAAGMISKMQKTLAEAAAGQDAAAIKDLQVLGLDPQKLTSLSADQKLLDIGRAINEVANADQRAQIATDLFGKSGAELLEVFRDGKAMDELSQGAGKFGAVMERNAATFHEAIFDLHEVSEIGKKFWAGVLDLIPVQEITDAVSHALESTDFVGFGQKFGAWVGLVIDGWKQGRLDEIIGLTIQAGFELGEAGVQKLWEKIKQLFSTDTAKLLGATFAMEITKGLANAFLDLAVLLGEGFIRLSAFIGQTIEDALTGAINRVIDFINGHPKIAKLFGGPMTPLQPEDLNAQADDQVGQMKSGADVLKGIISDFFDNGIKSAKQLWGMPGTADAGQSAVAQLNSLLEKQIKLRESVKTEIESENGKAVQAFNVTKDFAQREIDLTKDLLNIKKQLATLDGDFTKTNAEKFATKKKLLTDEVADYQKAIDKNNGLINSDSTSTEDKAFLTKKNESLTSGMVNAQDALSKMGADPNSFGDQFAAKFTDLQNQWGTTAQQMAQSFADVFNTAISSISSGITGLIMGTKTWGQALQQIGSSILETVIGAIVKMFVTWVVNMIVLKGLQKLFGSQSNQEAAQSAAAWGPAAVAASIASYGSAAAVGTASAIAGMAAGAIFAGALSSAGSGFVGGGYTGAGGRYEPAGVVHRGEFVMSAPAVNRIGLPALESLHSGDATGASSGAQTNLALHVWGADDSEKMNRHVRENPEFRHAILDLVTKEVRWA